MDFLPAPAFLSMRDFAFETADSIDTLMACCPELNSVSEKMSSLSSALAFGTFRLLMELA